MNFNWICLFVYLWDFCQQIIKKKHLSLPSNNSKVKLSDAESSG